MPASSSWPWSSCTDMQRDKPTSLNWRVQGHMPPSCMWLVLVIPCCVCSHRYWLKSSVSLVTVMGLTWIIGVLVFELPALLPLAYIFTIFVAFQGVAIFVIFVPLSKQVREAYSKWWKVRVAESDTLSRLFGDWSLRSIWGRSSVSSVPVLRVCMYNVVVMKISSLVLYRLEIHYIHAYMHAHKSTLWCTMHR